MRLTQSKALAAFVICSYLFQPLVGLAAPHSKSSASNYTAHVTLSEDAQVAHVLNRLAYGPRPGDMDAVKRMGVKNFIQSQLHPQNIQEDPSLNARLSQTEAINTTPMQLFLKYGIPPRLTIDPNLSPEDQKQQKREQQRQMREQSRAVLNQAAETRVWRALYSNRQLEAVMTEFWYNHFNIFGAKGLDALWVGNFEETAIRPNALGHFRDLLEATSHHPAMQFYLDNWQNSAPVDQSANNSNGNSNPKKTKGLNENYARELMELHTLGVDGGYTQQDVIALAHILTGWGFAPPRFLLSVQNANNGTVLNPRQQAMQQQGLALLNGNGFYFDAKRHDFADKQFLGHTIKGSGEAEGEQALDILARHPATAKFISTKLAQYFVSDQPSPALIARLSQRFTQTDGDIRAVLETLFQSPEFWSPNNVGSKYKTPYRYVVSTVRATNTPIDNIRPLTFAMTQQGMPIYGCETPNGYRYTQDAWLSPDGMTQRLNFALSMVQNQLRLQQNATAQSGITPLTPKTMAETLIPTIGVSLSDNTQAAVLAAPQSLRPSLILGSPEFMKY